MAAQAGHREPRRGENPRPLNHHPLLPTAPVGPALQPLGDPLDPLTHGAISSSVVDVLSPSLSFRRTLCLVFINVDDLVLLAPSNRCRDRPLPRAVRGATPRAGSTGTAGSRASSRPRVSRLVSVGARDFVQERRASDRRTRSCHRLAGTAALYPTDVTSISGPAGNLGEGVGCGTLASTLR